MSSGDTKPPDPGTRTPIDLARVVVKPTISEIPQPTHVTLPRVQPSTSVISATAASGQSIFTPSPSHLIVPTAAKTASLRPPIRSLQPTPTAVIGANVQKIVTAPQINAQVKTTPVVVPHVTRNSVIPLQSKQVQQRTIPGQASLIRPPQFSSHVPRGPAAVASITPGAKGPVANPIIRQTGQSVVVTSNHLTARTGAALNLTRSFAPVTMVEVSKNQPATNQLHLGIPSNITIEPSIRSGPKQTVVPTAIYQPVVTGEKGSPTTTTLFKTSTINAAGVASITANPYSKATTFTPITTTQAQAIVQPSTAQAQAVTITGKTVPVSNTNQFSKLANPVFVTNKNSVNNVVITTSQRPMRTISTTQAAPQISQNISLPVTKVYQQPLTVTGSDIEQPIGFVTGGAQRLQLPVLNVGQSVQGTQPGTVVVTGDASRNAGTTQYAVQTGAYLTYETYPTYFGGPGGAGTPVHLTGGIPGVRTVTPRPPFTNPRPLMVTVDTKNSSPSNNVISVTATKPNHISTSIDAATLGNTLHAEVTLPRETTITKLTTPIANSTADLQTYQTSKLSNITDKVITQALATPVNPPTAPLPISVTGITSSASTMSNTTITTIQPQGSPSRPAILRKRPASSIEHFAVTAAAAATLNTTTTLPGGSTLIRRDCEVNSSQEPEDNNNLSEHQNGQVSPRKKPRKQLLQSNDESGEKRQENGKGEDVMANLSRPQLFSGPQHGWKTRLNHFARHSDVRCRDDKKLSVNELANQKSAAQRAHGWKLYHIKGQVEEVESIESDVFHRFNKILDSFETINRTDKASVLSEDEKVLNKITDLIKGNLQRSQLMQDQFGEVKRHLVKVLDYKPRVLDVIGKHISKRPLKKREKL